MGCNKILTAIWSRLLNKDSTCDEHTELLRRESQELKFPKSVFFIIGNEFCERFSYYGLRTVLALYLTTELMLTEDSATSVYHGWTFLCYSTTLIGAVLADSYLGRYRTIFYLSIVYLLGNTVLSLAAIKPVVPSLKGKTVVSACGLLLIALGTGGIKPCVSAFGGDQFVLPQQEHQLSKFFSVFYFSINAGALLSTLLTPILRKDVTCFKSDCFALAFGVPAVLMLIAIVFFLVGTPRYRNVPPNGNVAAEVIKCITFAGYRNLMMRNVLCKTEVYSCRSNTSHWLDVAREKFPISLVQDVKKLLRVLVLFLPLPFFWALFDQQGSRWTFQATKMSGQFGIWTVKPDQMQVLNPLLIMFFIPLFDSFVYPFMNRWQILMKPLHRMFVGGLFAAFAFIVSGFLQMKIENCSPSNETRFNFATMNALSCTARVNLTQFGTSREIHPFQMIFESVETKYGEKFSAPFSAQVDDDEDCAGISKKKSAFTYIQIANQQEQTIILNSYLGNLELVRLPQEPQLPVNHLCQIRFVDTTDALRFSHISLRQKNATTIVKSNFFSKGVSASKTESVRHGRYDIILPSSSVNEEEYSLGLITTLEHSSQIILLYTVKQDGNVVKKIQSFNMNCPSVHMLWIFPQYVLISLGEIMFAVTGLQFSFTNAPESMKSVVQASWLLTVAFGNLIVVIIAESKVIERQSLEFFLFAGLMIIDMLLFLFLANRFYRFSTAANEDDIQQPNYINQNEGQYSTYLVTDSSDSEYETSL